MYRASIAHVLVGILLTCPFFCLHQSAAGSGACGAVETAAADSDGNDAGCPCCPCCPCRPSGSKPDRSGPKAPQPRGGGACLCHGAVMERHATPPTPDLQFVSAVPREDSILHPGPMMADGSLALNPSTCDFATVFSGRTLRALIASFLI